MSSPAAGATSATSPSIRHIPCDTLRARSMSTGRRRDGLSESRDLEPQDEERRVYLYCSDPDGECPFSRRQSPGEGLPVLTVDEEIYRLTPSMVIGTVDKLAQIPWRGQAGMIFGRANRRCSRHGFRHTDLATHPRAILRVVVALRARLHRRGVGLALRSANPATAEATPKTAASRSPPDHAACNAIVTTSDMVGRPSTCRTVLSRAYSGLELAAARP